MEDKMELSNIQTVAVKLLNCLVESTLNDYLF